METNLLKALININQITDFSLPSLYSSSNRMNNMGVALEYFVKDSFCDSFSVNDLASKDRHHSGYLSYLGNPSNPPDFIIRNGAAVEVKKIENFNSALALNSSHPKNKLYADNPLITDACRNCEEWDIKDMIYATGVVIDDELKSLWFVYGDCYAAEKSIYERPIDAITVRYPKFKTA